LKGSTISSLIPNFCRNSWDIKKGRRGSEKRRKEGRDRWNGWGELLRLQQQLLRKKITTTTYRFLLEVSQSSIVIRRI